MLRTSFNSSQLVRLLADLSTGDADGTKPSFAERLGQWLSLTDAIALSGALKSRADEPAKPRPHAPASPESGAAAAHAEALARLNASLTDSIMTDGVLRPGPARVKMPAPIAGASAARAADFAPYRRYYAAHQRDMDAGIAPLRANVRVAMARVSPTLHQLATLDAAFEKVLGERERNLLANVPQLLERRHAQRYQAHREALAARQQADDPALWLQPGGWLEAFSREMQHVLLAELEIRLQPITGLVEAFSNEVSKSQ